MINNEYKFIFIHIPKTGGISVENRLPSGIYPNHHLSLSQYKTKEALDFCDYFKFAFVRNPWDRMVSLYFFWRNQDRDHEFYKWDAGQVEYLKKNKITFGRFVKEACDGHSIFNREHLRAHTWYTSGLDFIGRFESLQEDFDIACDRIGTPRQKLPHHNKTDHKHYAEYYDDESRQIVGEKYANDIKSFGYVFEG